MCLTFSTLKGGSALRKEIRESLSVRPRAHTLLSSPGCLFSFQDQLAIMLISYIFLGVSLLNSLNNFHVSSCDLNCTEKPVFTPSRLVVKYGDPTSANCSVCQHCQNNFGLEIPVGDKKENGTLISWTVDHLTEWGLSPTCYYTVLNTNHQCCSILNITLYHPPDNVVLNIKGNSWVWSEGQNIPLECSVQNVAPVENLTVTFYRGQRQLGQKQSNKTGDKPVSETFHLDFTSTKEDDGGEFWCEAELLLGPDGPQPPPVVKSQNFSATVFYEPYLTGASHPSPTVLTEGNPLQLDCSAVGNPRPTYTWAVPSGVSPTKSSVLIINSTTTEDKGQYTCFVSNNQGNVTVKFDVEVKRDYTKHHIAAAIIGAAVVIFLVVIIYFKCYKK
ncbi:cell adhesion molecule 4-like isoform X3 [Acanthopagrus latus]|uniref:cell adhesion molecule 4-like isoform X3 n=1 Tax=Acanthopagrus latus TaxID=8177 RepID=UPI00187C470B|nr:cell adhesion molecule 4-like isoform X3 [Acanthopagrus latus]